MIRIIKKAVFAGVILALVGGAVWFWLRPARVTTAAVAMRDISPAIRGVGTVEAKVVVLLAAKVPGRVTIIAADQGDTVRKGQTLIELENAEARAELERAGANFARAQLAVPAQEAAVFRAQANLAAADAAIAKAKSNRMLARANADRWRKLAATGDVPQMDLDARVTAAEFAEEELKSAEAQREAGVQEIAAQKAAVAIVRSEVVSAAAARTSVQAKKADTIIASPMDGFVVSRELEPGATVNPGTPILKLADPRSVWVTVFVDEVEAGGIAVGDRADLALRSLPGRRLQGKVVRLRRESDRVTEQFTVDIAFDEPPALVTLGEQAEATIRPAARRTVAMPPGAVVRTPDGLGAWTVVDGRLHFKQARLGVADPSGWIEITEGLAAGEQVVVAPGKLSDPGNEGRRVAVVAPASGRP